MDFVSYLRRNVRGWMGMTLWYVGIRRPFKATFLNVAYEINDSEDYLKLFRTVREQYLCSVLRNKLAFFEEGSEEGRGFFQFPFEGSKVKIFFWEGMRRETLLA